MYNSVQTGRIDFHLPGTDPTEGKSFPSTLSPCRRADQPLRLKRDGELPVCCLKYFPKNDCDEKFNA